MIEKLQKYIDVKDEILKRIEDIINNKNSVYNDIYLLETLKHQLETTQKLINKELENEKSEKIICRKDITIANEQKVLTNIDNQVIITNQIINDEIEIIPSRNDIELYISANSKTLNKVYATKKEENDVELYKDEVLGYIIKKENYKNKPKNK